MAFDIRELLSHLSDVDFEQSAALALRDIVVEIHDKLRGHEDISPIPVSFNPAIHVEEDMLRLGVVRLLTDEKLIYWNPEEDNPDGIDYLVTVVNRYKFEKLYLKITGQDTANNLPNLVYYNPMNGTGFINGNSIKLKPKSKRKAKELFDIMAATAPNPVPRQKLLAILRLTPQYKVSPTHVAEEVSSAFNNLRKHCGVDASVIQLHGDGLLNAQVMLVNKFPDFFIFPDEIPEII